jgi:hypothetical protein
MSDTTKVKNEPEQDVIDRLWLLYFNDTLYARGLISETERNQMHSRINARTSKTHRQEEAPWTGNGDWK